MPTVDPLGYVDKYLLRRISDRMAFFICYANVLTRVMYSVLPVRSCLFYEEQYENREHCDHMRKQGGGGMFTYTVSFYIDKDDWKSPASDLYTNE